MEYSKLITKARKNNDKAKKDTDISICTTIGN